MFHPYGGNDEGAPNAVGLLAGNHPPLASGLCAATHFCESRATSPGLAVGAGPRHGIPHSMDQRTGTAVLVRGILPACARGVGPPSAVHAVAPTRSGVLPWKTGGCG